MADKRAVARVLDEISRYLELTDADRFRAIAFRNAARSIDNLDDEDLQGLAEGGRLTTIPGVGKAISPVITEVMTTGRSQYLDELRQGYPPGIFDLVRLPGLGLKKIGVLHRELGVGSVDELALACRENRLIVLRGFGAKTQARIAQGIVALSSDLRKFLLPAGIELGERLAAEIRQLPGVRRAELAGSVRRRLEVIRNINLCVEADSVAPVLEEIASLGSLASVQKEKEILRAELGNRIAVEIVVSPPGSWATNFLFTTGSESFVQSVVSKAAKKGFDLSSDGMRKQRRKVAVQSEEEIFDRLGLPFVEPELREDRWRDDSFPPAPLIERADLRGTFHVHTTYSDGRATLREILDAARDRGLSYIGISDHSVTASYARGLTDDRLREQHEEIDRLQKTFLPMRIFRGTEADILPDGSVDYGQAILSRFDFVIASVHSQLKMPEAEMTARIIRAIRNPFVTFVGHLTGRILLSRPGYSIDHAQIFDAAAEEGVMIEINGSPHRLEIDWRLLQEALQRGVRLSIHPDAHSTDTLDNLDNGTWVARKGGLRREDVFNTLPLAEVERHLEARKRRAGRA